jgi:short-subunit dehydrogenase
MEKIGIWGATSGRGSGIGCAILERLINEPDTSLYVFARSDTKIDKLTVTLPKIRGSMAWELKDEDRSENYRRYLVDNDINNIVSTVGLGIGSPIPFLSHGELNEMIAANLVSPFLILKHSALSLKQLGGGRIVLFGSIVSIQPEQGASGYSATKMGLRGLVESARRELSKRQARGV